MQMLDANALDTKRKDLIIYLQDRHFDEAKEILDEIKYFVFATNLPKFLNDSIEQMGGVGLQFICKVWDLDLIDLTQGRPTIGNFMYRCIWVNESLNGELEQSQIEKVRGVVQWLINVIEGDASNPNVLRGFGDFFSLNGKDAYCDFNLWRNAIREWASMYSVEIHDEEHF